MKSLRRAALELAMLRTATTGMSSVSPVMACNVSATGGGEQKAMRGETFILHPGETHDGRPGTNDGYGYRSIHISPRHIAEAIGGRRIPFVKDAVSTDRQLAAVIVKLLKAEDTVGSDIEIVETLADLARTRERLSRQVHQQDPMRYETIPAHSRTDSFGVAVGHSHDGS